METTYYRDCNAISTLDMIKHWLTTTNEKHLLLMEDDYDYRFVKYWHFDWEYLMNHIPFDWDCIQLGFENEHEIPCFLHPIRSHHDYGPVLINRPYAEKLMRLFVLVINTIFPKRFKTISGERC